MNAEIVWTAQAEDDLQQAYNRLDAVSADKGAQFIRAVDGALTLIRTFPRLAPLYEPPFRRLLVKKSYYGVFYAVENRGIIVHAVIDLRQDPRGILKRLPGKA